MRKLDEPFTGSIEYILNGEIVHMYDDPLMYLEMLQEIRNGEKIGAIKIHRAHRLKTEAPHLNYISLKESKDFVVSIDDAYLVKFKEIELAIEDELPEYYL